MSNADRYLHIKNRLAEAKIQQTRLETQLETLNQKYEEVKKELIELAGTDDHVEIQDLIDNLTVQINEQIEEANKIIAELD